VRPGAGHPDRAAPATAAPGLAVLLGVDRATITRAIGQIRPLLAARGFAVPGQPTLRLPTLADVVAYAAANGPSCRSGMTTSTRASAARAACSASSASDLPCRRRDARSGRWMSRTCWPWLRRAPGRPHPGRWRRGPPSACRRRPRPDARACR
jgi:hypothetical protein